MVPPPGDRSGEPERTVAASRQGRIAIAHFTLANLVISNFTSTVELNNGGLSLKDLSADLLGGHHSGNWDIDFTAKPPKYFGSGSVSKIAMVQVAALMHDPWATGILSGQYTLGSRGLVTQKRLRDSASGSAAFKWTAGSLRHVTLAGQATPLTFADFEGNVTLQKKTLLCQDCQLKTTGATLRGERLLRFRPVSGFEIGASIRTVLHRLWPA